MDAAPASAPAAAGAKPPTWYRVTAWLLFAWMLIGILGYLAELRMTPEAIAAMPEGMQALYAIMPGWMRIIYGVATVSGLAGALGLILRKAWSLPLLILSLVAVVVQMSYWLFGMKAMELLGTGAAGMPIVVILLGAFAIWFAMMAKKRGVIAG